MKNLLTAIVVSFLVAGCIHSTNFTPIGQPLSPHQGEVKILETPPDNFLDVGWISCEGDNSSTWLKYLEKAKVKAAQHGANAIIFSPVNAKEASFNKRSILCKAIYIKE